MLDEAQASYAASPLSAACVRQVLGTNIRSNNLCIFTKVIFDGIQPHRRSGVDRVKTRPAQPAVPNIDVIYSRQRNGAHNKGRMRRAMVSLGDMGPETITFFKTPLTLEHTKKILWAGSNESPEYRAVW